MSRRCRSRWCASSTAADGLRELRRLFVVLRWGGHGLLPRGERHQDGDVEHADDGAAGELQDRQQQVSPLGRRRTARLEKETILWGGIERPRPRSLWVGVWGDTLRAGARRWCPLRGYPWARCSSAAVTPPRACGTPASARPISTPERVPQSIRSLNHPRWPMRKAVPLSFPRPCPSDMSNLSRMSARSR